MEKVRESYREFEWEILILLHLCCPLSRTNMPPESSGKIAGEDRLIVCC